MLTRERPREREREREAGKIASTNLSYLRLAVHGKTLSNPCFLFVLIHSYQVCVCKRSDHRSFARLEPIGS